MALRIGPTIVLATIALTGGCTSAGQRIEQRARAAGLETIQAAGGAFPALIYMKRADASSEHAPLLIFIEGDGVPWRDGTAPSADPTTRNPVALELMIRSRAPAAYITRPCYGSLRVDKCTAEHWTGARYSNEIVESMVTAVHEAQRVAGAKEVSLIGYSGGGALAALIAERIENVYSVLTLAGNLDTDAWTALHGYLPLSQSLNPSLSEREHPWSEMHLQGADDRVVPIATTDGYFTRYPQARRRTIAGYDHVCCWLDDWAKLVVELGAGL
jgi:hypothetical protein